jgi:methyl-accepting chemotaxis protein
MEQEYQLPEDAVILSTADMNGNILTYNMAFLEASGYTADEIRGKPHSLLRHPDMPKAAFQDLWQTIQAGNPWFGIVKNRRKNGDYYWVAANVSPIFDHGRVKGYVSVRYPASSEQKQAAAVLYVRMAHGKAQMPWTPKASLDRLGLAGMLFGFVGLLIPYLLADGLVLGSLLTVSGFGLSMWRGFLLSRPSVSQLQAIHNLSNGVFRLPIVGHDAWTTVLNLLRTRIGQNACMTSDAARESAILTTAMNATSTNMMVVDMSMRIVSMNRSLITMLTHNEPALRLQLPHFSVQELVGASLNVFRYDPNETEFVPEGIVESCARDMVVSDVHLRLVVMPIVREGQRLGYVIEWFDRTQEVLIERRISAALDDLASGRFDSRVETIGLSGFTLTLSNRINKAIATLSTAVDDVVQSAQALSHGDLTAQVHGDYQGGLAQIKTAMNEAVLSLNRSFAHVQGQATEVADASSQVSQANLGLSDRIQAQASAIEQTASTMMTLTAQVQQSASSAENAAQLAGDSAQEVRKGAEVMHQAIVAMNEISDVSHQITGIVSLIDSIAFQTNLLALNAAVEAARAGEHGRGFAVVASEVRALAGKSAEAAKDIKGLIDQTALKIHVGTEKVQETGAMLDDVLTHFDQMVSLVSDISQSAAAQARGLKETNTAMIDIDRAVQQGAGLVKDNAALAQYLGEVAQNLDELVCTFKLKAA